MILYYGPYLVGGVIVAGGGVRWRGLARALVARGVRLMDDEERLERSAVEA